MKTNIVYNEDFLSSNKVEDSSIDMVITSPPYFNARDYSNWDTYEDYLDFSNRFIKKSFKLLKDGGRIPINVPDGYDRNPWITIYADYCKLLQKNDFIIRGNIIWYKYMGGTLGGRTSWGSWRSSSNPCLIDQHEMIVVAHKGKPKIENASKLTKQDFMDSIRSVWEIQPQKRKNGGHPAPFPIEIPKRLINLFSGNNSIVLDPFMGSFTTAIACCSLNRKYIGYEIMKEYYDQGLKRLQDFQRTF